MAKRRGTPDDVATVVEIPEYEGLEDLVPLEEWEIDDYLQNLEEGDIIIGNPEPLPGFERGPDIRLDPNAPPPTGPPDFDPFFDS